MKEKNKLIFMMVIFVILLLIGASIIGDILKFLLGGKINSTGLFIIQFILVFVFIEILLRTKFGKYIEYELFKKSKKKKSKWK
ncbi:MAG: hypothetical protein AABX84_01785 [Nanoarchaeota archaeon]